MIAFGLTVFNRRNLLVHSAPSIRRLVSRCKLVVLNDGSTEFTEQDLRDLLPEADIHSNERNSGRADFAAVQLANMLLQQDARYLVMLDSDLMCHAGFVEALLLAMPHTDGLFSALNADSHAPCSRERIPLDGIENALLQKKVIGNAGSIWTRELLAEIVREVPPSPTWDWDYSDYISASGRRIFCLERSTVQHLGFWVGQNSGRMNGVWGLGYPTLSGAEASTVAEMLFLGTKTAFGHLAEESSSRSVSAHHFHPAGQIKGRARVHRLKEPLHIEASISLEAGYQYLFVDATIVKSIFPQLAYGAVLELTASAQGRLLSSRSISVRQMIRRGDDHELRLEFDLESPARVKIELRYLGPSLRQKLRLCGLLIDRVM